MPRESSKCRQWEKERRNRLNERFTALNKLLPSYDPMVAASKADILGMASNYIEELQIKIKQLLNSTNLPESISSTKDDEIKKLQDRIRRLITKNEQLCRLLREAKIAIPKGYTVMKKFRRLMNWSGRIPVEQAKILQRHEMEKENTRLKPKSKACKLSHKLKYQKLRKANTTIVQPQAKCVILLPPAQQTTPYYILSNPNDIKTGTTTVLAQPQPTGTLILANSSNMILPQIPHIIPINPTTPQQSTILLPQQIKDETQNGKILNKIKPKGCLTRTTQINKVPIPALTSKYCNNDLVLKHGKCKRDNSNSSDKKLSKNATVKLDEPSSSVHKKSATIITKTNSTNNVSSTGSSLNKANSTHNDGGNKTNLDTSLSIGHSDLSNDIFATLQVPSGCQNAESTSPTAAFLLAFPLVSSMTGVKVNEVVPEEDNSTEESQPTLLQIGGTNSNANTNVPSANSNNNNSTNNTPTTQSDSLLLDNLTFFSSKDFGTLYNHFDGTNSNGVNHNKNTNNNIILPTTTNYHHTNYENHTNSSNTKCLYQDYHYRKHNDQQYLKNNHPPPPPPTINWMTTPDHQKSTTTSTTQNFYLNQSNQIIDDSTNQFPTWSPTKVPQFFDNSLPTLIGDLALGTTTSTTTTTITTNTKSKLDSNEKDQRTNLKRNYNHSSQSSTNHNSNFLSVSQMLVEHHHTTKEIVPPAQKTTATTTNRRTNNDSFLMKSVPSNNSKRTATTTNLVNHQAKNVVKNSCYSAESLIGSNSTASSKFPMVPPTFLPPDNLLTSYFPTSTSTMDLVNSQDNNNSFLPPPPPPPQNQSFLLQDFNNTTHDFMDNFNMFPNSINGKEKPTNKSVNYCNNNNNNNVKKVLKRTTNNLKPLGPVNNNVVNMNNSVMNNSSDNFVGDFSFLSSLPPGSINSPLLPDDFHTASNTNPPLYQCKNQMTYNCTNNTNINNNGMVPKQQQQQQQIQQQQNQQNESMFSSCGLLPLPPPVSLNSTTPNHNITTTNKINNNNNIFTGGYTTNQSMMESSSTSLANFNLSTIFPEINNKDQTFLPLPNSKTGPSNGRLCSNKTSSNHNMVFNEKPNFHFSSYNSSNNGGPHSYQSVL